MDNSEVENNEFLKKFQGEIKDEQSFQKKTRFVAEGLDGKKQGPIAKIWEKVQALWNYVRSDQVHWSKKVLPLAGLVYLVSPVDLIPDIIPVVGLVDDAGVLGLIVMQMGRVLTSFAVAAAIIAVINSDLIDKWIDTQRTRYPDADTVELVRTKLANGNFRVVALISEDGNKLESQTWEGEQIAPELAAVFGPNDKIVYDLTS